MLYLMQPTVTVAAAPATDSYKIVFPENEALGCFDSGFYSPNLTDGRASPAEVQEVLRELYGTKGNVAASICWIIFVYMMIIFIGVFAFVFIMVVLIAKSMAFLPICLIGLVLIICASVYYLISAIQGINTGRNLKGKAIIDRYNPVFASRGLRWHIPSAFGWVELWKDYSSGSGATQAGHVQVGIGAQSYGQPSYQTGPTSTAIYQAPPMHQPQDANIYHAPSMEYGAQQGNQQYQANYYK